jgi:hypothetical protein
VQQRLGLVFVNIHLVAPRALARCFRELASAF